MKTKALYHGRILVLLAVILFTVTSCEDNYFDFTGQDMEVNSAQTDLFKTQTISAFTQEAALCGEPLVTTLFAGQNIESGTVTIANDDEYLYVTYSSDVLINEVHLFATKSPLLSRVAPGRAPFKAQVGDYYHTFKISFDELGVACGEIVYLQAHAALANGETAYGGTITKPNRGAWFGTITYDIACCDDITWNFPVWTQDISHVILVFQTASGVNSVKVDDFPNGYKNLNLLMDDILNYLGYDANSLLGVVIKGGNQPALYFDASGNPADLPEDVGFFLGGQNVGNPSAIDEVIDFEDIFGI